MASDPMTVKHLPSFSAHITLTVAPENADTFLRLAKPAYEAIIAEPDCVFFEILQHPENPGEFRFVETWNAGLESTLAAMAQKEFHKEFVKAIDPLLIGPKKYEIWGRLPGEWSYSKKV